MALARFFDRIYGAIGGHLPVSKESLAALLENVVVGIKCGAGTSPNDSCIAELVTNLLARLYPRVAIIADEPLYTVLRNLAFKINPKIEIADDAPGFSTICVGSTAADGALYPSATGWVAHLFHCRPRASGHWNPYASGFAAALATAELFRRIFLKVGVEPDVSISLLDFGESRGADLELSANNIGDVAFVGVGAVGNAAIWALARHTSAVGHLRLIDEDVLLLPNLQRYILAVDRDVSASKTRLAGKALSHGHLTFDHCRRKLESLARKEDGIHVPTVCISVDNVPSRRAAQALLPKLVVNGWTGDQALGSSWHIFSRDTACLACLYHPHGQGCSQIDQAARAFGLAPQRAIELWITRVPPSHEDFKRIAAALGVGEEILEPWQGKSLGELYTDVVCGAVPLSLPTVGRIETVPLAHQSALAGILMAAELVKRTNPDLGALSQAESLVAWDDILRPPPPVGRWAKPRPREPGCICGDPIYQAEYHKKWEMTAVSGSRG